MSKRIYRLTTDADGAAFPDQGLSDLDFAQLEPARIAFEEKPGGPPHARPEAILEALQARASYRGIP